MRGPVINAEEYRRINGLLQEAVALIREAEGELENFNPDVAQKLADWLRLKAQGY